MAGTMGRMTIGVTGLQNSQYALNATAHNLINTQTEGYTRQQVLLTDRSYNKISTGSYYTNSVGMGVLTAEIRQVRDNFADAAYRTESGRMNYYKAQYETVSEIENYFGELEGKDFNTTLNDLWSSLQELQKESNSIVTRSSFISNALTFVDRVHTIRSSLIEYQRNLNTEIKDQVKRINDLADSILELNQKIQAVEAGDIENANDYKDQRNAALDELSG
ncbi:MAG: flagellar hook-associated protein FlgK, partial [Wujia sp.]